jgi:hypothetical protein
MSGNQGTRCCDMNPEGFGLPCPSGLAVCSPYGLSLGLASLIACNFPQ